MTYNPFEDSPAYLIGQTYRKINHLMTAKFKAHGLTTEQWIVMCCLLQQDGVSQTELSELAGKDKTTITRILDNLDRKGMIQKRANPSDRRAFFVDLTEAGRRYAEVLAEIERQTMGKLFDWDDATLYAFRRKMVSIQQGVDREYADWSVGSEADATMNRDEE